MNFIERRLTKIIAEYCQEMDICIDRLEIICLRAPEDEIHGLSMPDSDIVLFYFINHNDGEIEFFLPSQIESTT